MDVISSPAIAEELVSVFRVLLPVVLKDKRSLLGRLLFRRPLVTSRIIIVVIARMDAADAIARACDDRAPRDLVQPLPISRGSRVTARARDVRTM